MRLNVNGEHHELDVADDEPLLWVLRDSLGLTGTKYGCGKGLCGTCTVHVDGQAVRSCVVRAADVQGRAVTTIEGLGGRHFVQRSWIAEQVPQCGYCQPGFIMAAAALLERIPQPSDRDIDREITNLCRCGTYVRIRRAIHRAARERERPERKRDG